MTSPDLSRAISGKWSLHGSAMVASSGLRKPTTKPECIEGVIGSPSPRRSGGGLQCCPLDAQDDSSGNDVEKIEGNDRSHTSQDEFSDTAEIERCDSLMQDVKERMVMLDCLARNSEKIGDLSTSSYGLVAPTPVSLLPFGEAYSLRTSTKVPSSSVSTRGKSADTPNSSVSPQTFLQWIIAGNIRRVAAESNFTPSFRTVVMVSVTVAVLLACVIMSVPLQIQLNRLRLDTFRTYEDSSLSQGSMIEELTSTSANWAHTSTLFATGRSVQTSVLYPADRAVDVLWGCLRNYKLSDASWDGSQHLHTLARRSLVELVDQLDSVSSMPALASAFSFGDLGARAEYLYVGFATDDFAGASVHFDPRSKVDGTLMVASNEVLSMWKGDTRTFNMIGTSSNSTFVPSRRPWYTLQKDLSHAGAEMKSVRAWSRIYIFIDGNLGLTRTSPLAFCGNYSCFEGVVAADITLQSIVNGCSQAWNSLREVLNGSVFNFKIDHGNSAVFVVNHVSNRFPHQEGMLVGASHPTALNKTNLDWAVDSSHSVVSITARAILAKFGSWNASSLIGNEQSFTFSRAHGENIGMHEACEAADDSDDDGDVCLQVGTLSVPLDDATRWLVVLVSPAHAFSQNAFERTQRVENEFERLKLQLDNLVTDLHLVGLVVFAIMMLFSFVIGLYLSSLVSAPLRRLSTLMRYLESLDFAKNAPEAAELRTRHRVRIREVSELQDAFARLSRGLETFARFVPEAVVRNIVRGDERATRLHVSKRVVTIMFSDIKGFTTISESLKQRDLLLLLTRYLSVMTRIIEEYEGVVAEILGDGLLVFWNTPNDVHDHATKACSAALAMQQALQPLNRELEPLGIPNLAVRIGLHTGVVLSGNIGSDTKMKFGCMGDPVNLASRLEGLCKEFGVSILCSSVTHESLQSRAGFVCRKLDLVQVKGRNEPTLVYELMGQEVVRPEVACDPEMMSAFSAASTFSTPCKSPAAVAKEAMSEVHCSSINDKPLSPGVFPCSLIPATLSTPVISTVQCTPRETTASDLRSRAARYEEALDAFQAARFLLAHDLLRSLLADHPDDHAARRLLNRTTLEHDVFCKNHSCISQAQEGMGTWNRVAVMTDK